jgi:hypothetical protein
MKFQSMKKVIAIALISAMVFQPLCAEKASEKLSFGKKTGNVLKIIFGSSFWVIGAGGIGFGIGTIPHAMKKGVNPLVILVFSGGITATGTLANYLGKKLVESGINGLQVEDHENSYRAQSTY